MRKDSSFVISKEKTRNYFKNWLFFMITFIFIFSVGFLIHLPKKSICTSEYTIPKITYEEECNTIYEQKCDTIYEKECYVIYDTKTKEIPAVEQVDYNYTIVNFYIDISGVWNTYRDLRLIFRNNEGLGGEFKVKFDVTFNDGGQESWTSQQFFVQAGQTYGGIYRRYTNKAFTINNAKYIIFPPTKEKLVTKTITEQVPRGECKQVPKKECKQVPKQDCKQVPKTIEKAEQKQDICYINVNLWNYILY